MLPNSILPTDKNAVTEFQTQVLVFYANGNSTLHYSQVSLKQRALPTKSVFIPVPRTHLACLEALPTEKTPTSVRGQRLKAG